MAERMDFLPDLARWFDPAPVIQEEVVAALQDLLDEREREPPAPALGAVPDVLRYGMEAGERIRLRYTTVDGATIDRTVAPYEVKPHPSSGVTMLYATDTIHGDGQIHSFRYSGIEDAALTGEPFRPVWPTQPGSI